MRKLLSLVVCFFVLHTAMAQRTIIHCGSLIDTKNLQVLKEMSVIVEANMITGVQNGYLAGNPGDKIIDLKNRTVMPGLIDMHVHMEGETDPGSYLEKFTMNKADLALHGVVFAERTLMTGFTTVRDLGGTGANIALRNAINKGWIKGPRIFTACSSMPVSQ